MATELAKAYVQIVPSAQGITGSISDVLSGESSSAGRQAGENIAGSLGKTLKSTLVGLGIGKMLMDSIGNASEFESSMAKVSTLFAGDANQFAQLQSDILNMSSAYGLGATTLAEAAYSAESAGVPMEQLTSMLSGSAKLAMAGFTDIDTALSATAKTMNAYGDAAGSVEDIQKILIQTQNLGITTVGELGASLANVTPTAAAMGVGFDQVGAALAQMTASGVPTAQATTQLRSAMTELGKAGTKADKAFREAAKDTKYAGMGFKEAMNAGANLGDVFGLMQSYADATGVSMVDLWGSVEAGNAAMLIAGDVERFNSNLEQMSTSSDVVGKAYGKMSNTFGASMNRLKESAKNFMTTLFTGGDIASSFDQLLASIGDVGGKLKTWLTTGLTNLGQNLPQMMSSLLNFAGSILTALGEVDWITVGTTLINGIIGALGELGTRLAEVIGGAVTSVANGEVDFSALGTALLGGFGSVLESVAGVAQSILDAITGVFTSGEGENPVSSLFKSGEKEIQEIDWAALGENVLSAASGLVNLTGEALAAGFTAGYALISTIDWETLGTTVGSVANGLISLTGEALAAGFTAAESAIKTIDWAGLGETVGTVGNNIISLTGEVLAAGFTAAEALINGIDWEGLGTTAANAGNGLINLTGDVLAAGFTAAEALINGIDWAGLGTTAANAGNSLISLTGDTLAAGFTAAESLIKTIDWVGLGETVGTVANKLIGFTGEALAAPFEAAHGILKGINWEEVGAAMQSGIGDVWAGLTGLLGGLLGGLGDAAAGIGSGIGDAAAGLGKAIGDLFRGDEAKQAAEDLKKTMEALEKAINEGKTKVETAAKEASKLIKTGLETDLKAETMSAMGETAGSSIVSGIVSGVNNAAGSLMGAMRSRAMQALAEARSALGIHSPSAVMRDQVGRWIPEGIADGISRNSDMVGDAMREMSADLAGGDIADVAISQGRSLNGIPGQARGNENGNGDIISAIQGLRNDMRNLRLVVGEKVFGRAVVEYGGNRLNNYIGQAEGSEAAGYGA